MPGRYEITDDQGGVSRIYYDPDVAASRPLGVIQICTSTTGLTPDATDRVPASYRSSVATPSPASIRYYIQLEAVATTWRYLVTKKYVNNGITLAQLAIDGPIAFTGAVSGDSAVFTSEPYRPAVGAARRGLKLLTQPAKELRDLPDPDLTTPLGAVDALPNFVSDMFVYV